MTVDPNAPDDPAMHALLIAACAREVELLAAACTRIENALGMAVSEPDFTPEGFVIELQDLDRVRQTLNELGPFLRNLATPAPDTNLADLPAKLSLSDLRRRITSGIPTHLSETSNCKTKASSLGAIDWF